MKSITPRSKPAIARGDAHGTQCGSLDALRALRATVPAMLLPRGDERRGGWLDLSDPMHVGVRFHFGDYAASLGEDGQFSEYWPLFKQPTEYALLLDRLIDTPYAAEAWRALDGAFVDKPIDNHRRPPAEDSGRIAVSIFHELAVCWWWVHNEDGATDSDRIKQATAVIKSARGLHAAIKKYPGADMQVMPEVVGARGRPAGYSLVIPLMSQALRDLIATMERHIAPLGRTQRFQGQPRATNARLIAFARRLAEVIQGYASPRTISPSSQDRIVGKLAAAAFGLRDPLPATWFKNLRANEARKHRTKNREHANTPLRPVGKMVRR
jgi:hypothetical protein